MRGALVKSCHENYLITPIDGRTVNNWQVINHDSKQKVPESPELVQLLSEEADLNTESTELLRKTTLQTSMAREGSLLAFCYEYSKFITEALRPTFNQSTAGSPSPSPYFNQSPEVGLPQKKCAVEAFYKQQDDYMLNLAIKESLKTTACTATCMQYGELAVNLLESEEKVPKVECGNRKGNFY